MALPKRMLKDTLNDRQEAYCRFYVENGGNMRKAAELAGYEEALGVSPLEYELSLIGLEEETVRAAIDEKLERYRKK